MVEAGDLYSRDTFTRGILGITFSLLSFGFAVSLGAMPMVGSQMLVYMVLGTIPFLSFVCILLFVQVVVFGPIIGNVTGFLPFHRDRWQGLMTLCVLFWMLLLPFWEELRSLMHKYYTRCLRQNFFHGGNDIKINQLADCVHCPFVVLTATSSDFRRDGVGRKISELFLTPLHIGSAEVGYMRQPSFRSLAKCTALTAAGSLDAISLTMTDNVYLRIWLELSNFSWGDYLVFKRRSSGRVAALARLSGEHGELVQRLVYRTLAGIPLFLCFLSLLVGWLGVVLEHGDCNDIETALLVSSSIFAAIYALSFFSFFKQLEFLTMCPFIRQLHQMTGHCFVGEVPSPLLYITDGGVRDCTGIGQLLWRRCERILLVLAAMDPHDELLVLRLAMTEAEIRGYAGFYNPEDPRIRVDTMFERFKLDRGMSFLHVGISYCESGSRGGLLKIGHLYIVKNRLPPSLEHEPVMPLLTPEEIVHGPWKAGESGAQDGGLAGFGLHTDELGPYACCDCCHTRGFNCGTKFPHGNVLGYLSLSPLWFSSLARLGFATSEDVLSEVSRVGPLGRTWESYVKEADSSPAARPSRPVGL